MAAAVDVVATMVVVVHGDRMEDEGDFEKKTSNMQLKRELTGEISIYAGVPLGGVPPTCVSPL